MPLVRRQHISCALAGCAVYTYNGFSQVLLAGPRAGLWAIIPFQLVVMIGLGAF